ncbi:Phenol hydroxylase P1 protein [Pseudomonas fluorescens]|nr:Phenol hydroxylase P1 protein [Pseudomonas fluorescens]
MFVVQDWFELFVAQNLVFDGYLYPLVKEIVDRELVGKGASALGMLTAFMSEWYDETQPWVNSVLKTAAAESPANRELLVCWIATWPVPAREAIAALLTALGSDPQQLAHLDEAFTKRLTKLGLIGMAVAA